MNRNDQEILVQKIRSQYIEPEHGKLDELKTLDARVKRPAKMFAYIFGSLAAIIMGCGMSLVMTDIGATLAIDNAMLLGILIGVIGMVLAIINYPIYNSAMKRRKKRYANEILTLSEALIQQ